MSQREGNRGASVPLPDIIYPYRNSADDDELRYSLRSLSNVPHGHVWIIGDHPPKWVQGVKHVKRPNNWPSRFRNALMHVKAACEMDDLADRVVLMNDDFFILKPVDRIPAMHRGPVESAHPAQKAGGGSPWRKGIMEAARILRSWGIEEPLSYELHVPMEIERRTMVDVLDRALRQTNSMDIQQRTLYGNAAAIGGTRQTTDLKIGGNGSRKWAEGALFVSTTNKSFHRGQIGQKIRQRFGQPSPYES